MNLFAVSRWAFETGKRLRGQKLLDANESIEIAHTWADVFEQAGLDDDIVRNAVKKLATNGESISATTIIRASKALLPATTPSAGDNTDDQDRLYYRSILDWARKTHHCPRSWIDWTPDMEEHARSLGVMSEWTAPLMDWEKAETIRNSLFRLHGSTTENNK